MKPMDAILVTVLIESMIVSSIAAAFARKIKDPAYEEKMQEYKTKLAELLEIQ